MRRALLLLLPIAACVQPPAPQPRPSPPVARPVPSTPPPAPVVNWSDRTPAPGGWTYAQDARGSTAMFGAAGSAALFIIRCAKNPNRIFVSRPGSVAGRITLRSTHGAQGYQATPTGTQPPVVEAQLVPRDPQLDSMAFSRGRILIGLDGAADLILPLWPEFARVVEDCRG